MLGLGGTLHWGDGHLGVRHWRGRGLGVSKGEAGDDDSKATVAGAGVRGRGLRSSCDNTGLQWMIMLDHFELKTPWLSDC